jgi:hypothetical protein
MRISREAQTLPYGDYVTKYWLAAHDIETPNRTTAFLVPSFQRGVSWGFEIIEAFIESESLFLGSVILGSVRSGDRQLIDGLQRFVIGTALLQALYPRVLSTDPTDPANAEHFRDLANELRTKQPVFSHNHTQLVQFPRHAVRFTYGELVNNIKQYIDGQFEAEVIEFASNVTKLYLDKAVAIDSWGGWTSTREILQAFIGLNTVRVDLTVVDLIRAAIVDQATHCNWGNDEIESVENEFTDTFLPGRGKAKGALVPLATLINDAFDDGNHKIFPDWEVFTPDAIRRFLLFVNESIAAAERVENSFLFAITQAGALPLAICILFYYLRSLKGNAAAGSGGSQGGTSLTNELCAPTNTTLQELHEFYRACVRRSLNGDIGKTGFVGAELMRVDFDASLSHLAARICPVASGALDARINSAWLKGRLWGSGKDTSKVIFQAYQLPQRDDDGYVFAPIQYGVNSASYHIDHIIPTVALARDMPERERCDSLVNFCPVTGLDNRSFRELRASDKLRGGYAGAQTSRHPYMRWLSENSDYEVTELDAPVNLGEERDPPIGERRIDHLVMELKERL